MAVVRKKQDDKNLKILREIVTTGAGNRQCFDCGQKGPTYVNMTIGSFVCTRCSGVLRGLTPPHRVKSISMATFTPEEIEFLKAHGNDLCGKTWLGLWDPKRIIHQDQRELMIDKYERKRYFLEPASPLKSLTTAVSTTKLSSSSTSSSSSNNNINNINSSSNGNGNYNLNLSNNCNNSQQISNGGNTSSNSSSSINSITSNKYNDNSFKNITLTPPTSSRLHNGNNRHQNLNGFKDDNNIFINGNINNNQHHQPRPIVTNKASLNISSSLDSSGSNNSLNGFTPESDFVADFNTANIFNATSIQQNGFQNGGSSNNLTTNGPIRNGNNFINNGGNHLVNGFGNNNTSSNANANFADFDHAPIYNAAVYDNNVIKDFKSFASNFNNSIQNNNTPGNSNVNNSTTSNNNSINIFNSTVQQQQQEQQKFYNQNNSNLTNINRSDNNFTSTPQYFGNNLTNSNILTTLNNNTNSNNSYYNQQWNNWQQFQWPPPQQNQQQPPPPSSSTITSIEQNINSNQQQQQNHWSFPISARNNSFSSATNIGLNSTPPADRYAALKDLDEQLRETKVVPTATEPFINGTTVSSANPFNTSSPSMPIQQNQQQIANPFQVANINNGNNGLFGSPQQQQQQTMLQQQHQLQQQNLLQQQQQQQLQMQQQIQQQQQQQLFNNGGFGTNTNFGLFNFNNGNDFNGGVAVGSGGGGIVNGFNNNNNNNNNNNMVQQQQQQQQQPPTMISTGANGCGMMGFGGVHQITAGSNMSNMKNPFTASSVLNSNNPFL